MSFNLVVVQPFGGHKRGDVIADQTEVAKVLAGEDKVHVVKVAAPDEAPAEKGA
jgi:hypothetical protein